MEEIEEWRVIKDFPNYMVSSMGRVKNCDGVILKFQNSHRGYYYCNIYKNGNPKTIRIHRIVAETFIPNDDPSHKTQCNHVNECKHDNRVSNLEWTSPKQNANHATRNKRISKAQKNHKKKSKRINQYTIDGIFIKEWPSTMEIERINGFRHNNISSCCNGKYKQAYGYMWKYKEKDAA